MVVYFGIGLALTKNMTNELPDDVSQRAFFERAVVHWNVDQNTWIVEMAQMTVSA